MDQSLEQMERKYDLQLHIQRLETELEEQKDVLKLAQYEKREAEARAREYQGSLKSLLHRLSGDQEGEKERLLREARAAATRLETAKQSCFLAEHQLQSARSDLEQIPEIRPSEKPEWKFAAGKIKARYLLKVTVPLMDQGISALELARDWTQPKLHLEGTTRTRFGCQAAANDLAKEICRNVEDLNECLAVRGLETVELGPYFYSPEAYLVTAFEYGTLDQMNKAIDQMLACRRALTRIQTILE